MSTVIISEIEEKPNRFSGVSVLNLTVVMHVGST
jgi:hypothetical protein